VKKKEAEENARVVDNLCSSALQKGRKSLRLINVFKN
jgi:hypothetical protein